MQTPARLLIVCALLGESCTRQLALPKSATWNPESATFTWWEGQVNLPVGFTYQVDQGADTFQGHFTSADGKLVIQHDIGGYAGEWASRKQSFFFHENVVEEARVWIAKRSWPDGKGAQTTLVAVTFPDSGLANFYLKSSLPEDATVIDFIARSFRPARRAVPAAQVIRSFCHPHQPVPHTSGFRP